MNTLHAIFSNESGCRVGKIDESNMINYDVHEGTEQELKEAAYNLDFKFIHFFEEQEDDYDNKYLTYQTTTSTSR